MLDFRSSDNHTSRSYNQIRSYIHHCHRSGIESRMNERSKRFQIYKSVALRSLLIRVVDFSKFHPVIYHLKNNLVFNFHSKNIITAKRLRR